jgi:hypothetical protein
MGTECPRYIGWTYLHLLIGALVSALGAQYNVVAELQKFAGISDDKLVVELSLFVGIFIFIFLMVVTTGPLKYFFFFFLVILTGTTFRSLADRIGEEQTLADALGTISGIMIATTAVGFYDYHNNLSYWVYLGVALMGLVLGRLGMGVALIIGTPDNAPPLTGLNYLVSVGATFLFSLYIAYDTTVLKEKARDCDSHPDYLSNITELYTDILDAFMEVKVPGKK